MNSICPQCESILRNPKSCNCGWVLEEIGDIPELAHKAKPVNLRRFVESLNNPYEPGSDYGVENE